MTITKNYPLKDLNTFGLDVIAKAFSEIKSEEDIAELLQDSGSGNEHKFILGGGSNILFTKNLEALCIHNKITGIQLVKEDHDYVWIKCGGGEVWHNLVMYCVE